MNCIHLVDGEKGGVGKSVVAQAMFYYCLQTLRLIGSNSLEKERVNSLLKNELTSLTKEVDIFNDETRENCQYIPLILIDADRTNPDVKRVYDQQYSELLVEGFFTENLREQKTADSIFDASIGKIAIVNVPSAAKRAIDSWFSINDLFGLAESLPTPVKFVRWFVTNGEHNSMNLFVDSINKYSHKMTHVLVKNHHFSDDWNLLEEPVYATAISKALTIDFPTLKESCATEIRGSEMSYDLALNGEGYFRNKVVDRHVVKVFIDKFSAIFKQTEQFKNLEELGHNLYDNNLSGFSTSPLSISPENTITANNTVEQVSNEKTNARYTATKSQKSSKSSK